MIVDLDKNSDLYLKVSPKFQLAFNYLRNTDLQSLQTGRYEIDGSTVYASVTQYVSKLPEQGKWEAHKRYIDIQVIIQGEEKIYYAPITQLKLAEYDPNKDFQALSGSGDFIILRPGMFMILFPEDGHMPGMAVNEPTQVKKIVVKVAV